MLLLLIKLKILYNEIFYYKIFSDDDYNNEAKDNGNKNIINLYNIEKKHLCWKYK